MASNTGETPNADCLGQDAVSSESTVRRRYMSELRGWMDNYQGYCMARELWDASLPYTLAATQPAGWEQGGANDPWTTGGFEQQQQQPRAASVTAEYRVPSISTRIAAEFIDATVLLVIKAVAFAIIGEFIDTDILFRYDLDLLALTDGLTFDKTVLISAELILFELVNRLLVALCESCLVLQPWRCRDGGVVTGMTPGKMICGLRVVRVTDVQLAETEGGVRVTETRLSWIRSFLRALLKNYSLAFLLPSLLTVYCSDHYRTFYDTWSGTMVVQWRHD